MRDAFINGLAAHAKKGRDIYLLTGDLGFSVFEDFRNSFPHRFINVGIAEANMMGIAAGIALSGNTAVTYSIIPFTVARCLEQIKVDVCYQNADVKIVGVGAGYAYGSLGITHHATEDISILRGFPNLRILAPCDPVETSACLDLALRDKGPCYIRLGKNREERAHKKALKAKFGGSHTLKKGKDITVLVSGYVVQRVLEASRVLSGLNIECRVISMYSIKPIDKAVILKSFSETQAIVTVEEHGIIGGLGTAAGEVLAESGLNNIVFKRLGIPDKFCEKTGDRNYLLDKAGLSVTRIKEAIVECINRKRTINEGRL